MYVWQCTRSISPRIWNSEFSLRMHARTPCLIMIKTDNHHASKSCTLLFRVWQGWCWRSWFGRMTGPPQLPASTQLFTAPMGQFYNLFFVSSYIKTSYSVLGTCATFSCTAPVVRTLKGGARVMVALTVARKNYANLRHFCTIFKPNFAYKSKEIATSWTIKNIREL